jgi:uncharacterized membrane protein
MPNHRLGPCLLVLCIPLISATISGSRARPRSHFRALIIYSFALSFVTAPIALVGARLISDKLHDRDVAAVQDHAGGLLFHHRHHRRGQDAVSASRSI